MHREAHLLFQIMSAAAAAGCRLPLPAAVGQGLQPRVRAAAARAQPQFGQCGRDLGQDGGRGERIVHALMLGASVLAGCAGQRC